MASVYSGAGEGRYGTVQVKGSLEFGLQYNYKVRWNPISAFKWQVQKHFSICTRYDFVSWPLKVTGLAKYYFPKNTSIAYFCCSKFKSPTQLKYLKENQKNNLHIFKKKIIFANLVAFIKQTPLLSTNFFKQKLPSLNKISSKVHWRFTWSSAKTLQPSTRSVTEVILMSRFVDTPISYSKQISWENSECLAGLSSSRQNQKRKAQNQSEEAHAESCVRWGLALLHVAEQPRVEDALADRLAQRHVRPQRLFGRSDAQPEGPHLRQSPASVVPPRREGEWFELAESENRVIVSLFSRANPSKTLRPTAEILSSDWNSSPAPTHPDPRTLTALVSESSVSNPLLQLQVPVTDRAGRRHARRTRRAPFTSWWRRRSTCLPWRRMETVMLSVKGGLGDGSVSDVLCWRIYVLAFQLPSSW